MATWNADNTVITKKGNEILSKVQAGNGAITVSRIVTGAGYVSASQLYAQTAVTNIKQEMTITGNRASENGSTLDLRVDNSALAEGYLMYQIGIYVTHPDYTGEQLYLISQVADISHPDLIPAASEGVVTFNYSLYMEHANTSAVTVTVDPAGAVSMEDFLTHTNKAMCIERDEEPIEGTVLGEIVNATDDNGKVVAPRTVSKAVAHGTQTVEAVLNEHTQNLQTLGTASQSHSTAISGLQTNVTALQTGQAGKANLVDGKVPASELPSYVDDVLEYINLAAFPVTGESGKIYVDLNTNKTYRWSGSAYIEISASLALGETSSTAYRGDRGKAAYDHSLNTNNPHGVTAAQVGLGNVPNVATNDQAPTYTEASTLTALTSGEKMSVFMGKLKKAVTDLISHVGDSVIHITSAERSTWNAKQSALTFDSTPTSGSSNPVTSDGVFAAVNNSIGKSFRVTLPANAVWLETDDYFYVNLAVTGMKSTYDVVVDYIRSGVTTTDNARAADFDAIVFDVKTANGSIQVRKYSNAVATVDLPLLIKA